MGSMLLQFQDKYYTYNGDENTDEKGLAIVGYESAFLADLVAAFLFEVIWTPFVDCFYKRIYRDDGITVLKGKMMVSEVIKWLDEF